MNAPAIVKSVRAPRCLANASQRLGWVYCIRDDASKAVKIGFSVNPHRRFSQLQTANPNRLRLIGMLPHVEAFERFLHWANRNRRVSGEWFDDADEAVSEVFALLTRGDA